MADELQVELSTLEMIAEHLSKGAGELDAIGSGMPGPPEAGDLSALIGQIVGHFADNAGNFVVGMKASSSAVSKAQLKYSATDEASAGAYQEK
ncbi:hypothetical protein [Kineosporia babensis]|uniref:Uncharacterized protein n=1 Tax=Kineosporia babensis TaxID=499548 RepID=A0A9X1SUK5_9ACTN|nr:hypothetical protein [Kineosporia babensis]MCD5312999.1 hypothetical protein [Kineosporia babensis]